MTGPSDSGFWQDLYAAQERPEWDLKGPSPLLAELLELAPALAADAQVVVPGCGFGHDAADLARRGYRATGLDFAQAALDGARARYGDLAHWRQEDWFGPSSDAFDALFDYTCFVAMDPARRPEYVAACARRLAPGGLWLGAFFHTSVVEPPPFPVQEDDIRTLAKPYFEILHLGPATRSHPRRAGREFLLVARKFTRP